MLFLRNSKLRLLCIAAIAGTCFGACSPKMSSSSVVKKYSRNELVKDYDLLREIMEKFHPSLYWYTSKDSMDFYFSQYRSVIRDSMNQQQFGFSVLAPLTTKIRCGHTSFNFSSSWSKYFRGVALPSFPLYLKVWGDTMLVLNNLNRKDSIITRGTQITTINGLNARQLATTMFRYMPTDGYAENVNYIRLSNSFPYYHRNIFGLSRQYTVGYLDSLAQHKSIQIPMYDPRADSLLAERQKKDKEKKRTVKPPKMPRKDRLKFYRSLEYDHEKALAILSIHSFDNGYGLKKFLRRSFRDIKEKQSPNLVIDLRNNGGGRVDNYVKLAKYIRSTPFTVADTAVCRHRSFGKYRKYIQKSFVNATAMKSFTRKGPDGGYHFKYWEKHRFKPYRKKHYNGKVYVLTGGPTFSASTLFCHTVQGQENVLLLGEETGGGKYGNNGLMIPYVTLPVTKMRVTLPLFRIVQADPGPKDGRGVVPDVIVPPSASAIRRGADLKMETVKEMIR